MGRCWLLPQRLLPPTVGAEVTPSRPRRALHTRVPRSTLQKHALRLAANRLPPPSPRLRSTLASRLKGLARASRRRGSQELRRRPVSMRRRWRRRCAELETKGRHTSRIWRRATAGLGLGEGISLPFSGGVTIYSVCPDVRAGDGTLPISAACAPALALGSRGVLIIQVVHFKALIFFRCASLSVGQCSSSLPLALDR